MTRARTLDPIALRQRVAEARLLLVFTPALVDTDAVSARHPALTRLVAAAPWLGLVQVRPKALGRAGVSDISEAAATRDWTLAVLEALADAGFEELPVLVNDRVDVAALLQGRGVAGVHLGADDTPPEVARALLGDDALIGLSTHDTAGVLLAAERPVDLLGFGPIFVSTTKGYGVPASPLEAPRVQGPDRAWIASAAAATPLFPIGGIDRFNIDELANIGRAAVGSAILTADDPAAAARELFAALAG